MPKPAKDIIRKYSGEWAAARFIESYDRSDELALEQLESDPKRNVVFPSSSDLDLAQSIYKLIIADWLKNEPRHQELLAKAETELAKLRTAPRASQ